MTLIDFGDVVFSATINELAVALAYALFDGGSVQWRRLEYPSADAGRRIQDAGLPESLAARLIVGR